MRSQIFAIAGAAVTVVVIVFAVLALSGGSDNSLARAAENLQGQNVRIKFAAGVAQGNEDTALSGSGVVSADGKRGRLQMRAEVQGQKITITQLRAGGQVYIASNQFAGHLPAGKRWVHAANIGSTPSAMSIPEFASFLKNAGDVENKGETAIRGQRVTEYAGTFSALQLAKRTGGETAKRYAKMLGGKDVPIPMQVWIDDRGRPQRLTITLDGGAAGSASMTTDILEYGVKTEIQPPPADQVAEASELNAG